MLFKTVSLFDLKPSPQGSDSLTNDKEVYLQNEDKAAWLVSNYDDKSISEEEKKEIEKTACLKGQLVALDFDGTITADPKFFAELSKGLASFGAIIIILTGRRWSESQFLLKYLYNNGIVFDLISMYPKEYPDCKIKDEKLEEEIGSWKEFIIRRLGISVVIDDSDIYAKKILSSNPNVLLLKPINNNTMEK